MSSWSVKRPRRDFIRANCLGEYIFGVVSLFIDELHHSFVRRLRSQTISFILFLINFANVEGR